MYNNLEKVKVCVYNGIDEAKKAYKRSKEGMKKYMNILDIIAKKRDKKVLTKEEIDFFVNEYTKGNITDYQAAALIMAIYINGMTDSEITDLTMSMANSGDVIDLSAIGENIVDKHSTRRSR